MRSKRKRAVVEDESDDEIEEARNMSDVTSMSVSASHHALNASNACNADKSRSDERQQRDGETNEEVDEQQEWEDYMSKSNIDVLAEPSMSQIEKQLSKQSAQDKERAKLNVSEAGAIESITLTQFMCHNHFHLEFGPRINFIVGRNGSGKSAILNAIIVGLGGRATTTNRGKGLASFIKTGQTQAKIVIKICNYNKVGVGRQGFCFEDYGKAVVIERTLYSTGSTAYKIKSCSGKVMSDKKQVLDDIIRHFNIQVDNPICILNQEVSRNFLNTKNPADKYKFFMKATLLEDMKNDYTLAQTERDYSFRSLNNKMKILPETTKDLRALERKVKMFNDLEKNKDKFVDLNNEAMWAMINETKHVLNKSEKEIIKCEKKINNELEAIESCQQKLSDLELKKSENQNRFEHLKNYVQNLSKNLNDFRAKKEDISKEQRLKESDKRKLQTELCVIENDKRSLEKKIDDLELQFSDESHNNRKLQIEKTTNDIENLRLEETQLTEKLNEMLTKLDSLRDNKNHLGQEFRSISEQLNTRKYQKDRLIQGKSDRLQAFGTNFPKLVHQIEDAYKMRKFKEKPLGPIGAHIELKDYNCALAVELCLKNLIFAFCCDNLNDAKVLKDIMKSVCGNDKLPPIVTRKFGRLHDVSNYKVDNENYQSFLDLMVIKESPITNCLIDQLRIEQILFIPDYGVARNLLIESPPVNCYQAYTADGCVMYPQKKDSDFKSFANSNKKQAYFLNKNMDNCLKSLEQEIISLQKHKNDREMNLKDISAQIIAIENDLEKLRRNIKGRKCNILKLDNQLKELKSFGESPPVEISSLQEDLEIRKLKAQEIGNDIDIINSELEAIKNKLNEIRSEEQSTNKEYDQLLSERHPLKDELEKIKSDLVILNNSLEQHKTQLNAMQSDKSEMDVKHKNSKKQLKEDEEIAMKKIGKVIETNRSAKTIRNEITQLQNFLAEQENSIGNKEEIYARYREMNKSFKKMKEEVDALEMHLKQLKIALNLRRQGYLVLRAYYSMMTNFFFIEALKPKGFCGSLDIYHNNKLVNGVLKKGKTLEIKVNPKIDENSTNSQQRLYNDTRSLSGGERSFSTVAFILSLWESAHSPFKILDEVDVFMDMVTRKISLDSMIEFASQKSGKQYIFLSPLKLQTLPNPDLIKIFEMPEPERE